MSTAAMRAQRDPGERVIAPVQREVAGADDERDAGGGEVDRVAEVDAGLDPDARAEHRDQAEEDGDRAAEDADRDRADDRAELGQQREAIAIRRR